MCAEGSIDAVIFCVIILLFEDNLVFPIEIYAMFYV